MYMIPPNIAVVICSRYDESRTTFLRKILAQIPKYAKNFHIAILSNNNKYEDFISKLNYRADISLLTIEDSSLPTPFHLPWGAIPVFKELLKQDPSITHFLYLEDDIFISPELIHFLAYYTEVLQPYGFFPGAIRVEQTINETSTRRPLGKWYATDQTKPIILSKRPVFDTPDWYFVPLLNAHQGFYFHTREQMDLLFELGLLTPFRNSKGLPDSGLPREHAAAGLSWYRVPEGWPHRLLVPICKATYQIPNIAQVHHLGDKYANIQDIWGQLPLEDVIKVE